MGAARQRDNRQGEFVFTGVRPRKRDITNDFDNLGGGDLLPFTTTRKVRRSEMQQFIQCVRTGVLYPVSRVSRIEPVAGSGPPYCAVIADKEGEYDQAFLYSVDDLQATFVPATPGQKVIQANYGDGEFWYSEVPVVAWRLEQGDVEPIGPEGKIGDADNSTWLVELPDGRIMCPGDCVCDNLQEALERLKSRIEMRKRPVQKTVREDETQLKR
jgi:hypothetical protein